MLFGFGNIGGADTHAAGSTSATLANSRRMEVFIIESNVQNEPQPPQKNIKMVFVVLHLGCGYHTQKSEPALKRLAKEACLAALAALVKPPAGRPTSGGSGEGAAVNTDIPAAVAPATAATAAEAAMVVLEDSPLTNCGTGSNLNEVGDVECDASLMYAEGTAPPK